MEELITNDPLVDLEIQVLKLREENERLKKELKREKERVQQLEEYLPAW